MESRVTEHQAEIIIEDEGPGFDRSSVPDPTTEENLERLHGRGILLMEAYMHTVEWSRRGEAGEDDSEERCDGEPGIGGVKTFSIFDLISK